MLKNLVDVVRARAGGAAGALTPAMAAAAAAAPADVAELITLLGTRQVKVNLGWRSVESRFLRGLADTWQQVKDDTGESDPREGELASGVQIGMSAGGEVAFGVCWGPRGVIAAEIDLEDAMIRWFASWDAFLEHMKQGETKRGQPVPEGLAAILPAAAPAPAAPAAPPSGVPLWAGTKPAHPFAEAYAHFGVDKQAYQAGPTPAGRMLFVKRGPLGMAIRDPDGSVRTVPWTASPDVFGICIVPGRENALVCAGAPGPLYDLDLATGQATQRLPSVRWSIGFVDDQHFVAHEDGEARVYPYAGGPPIASTALTAMNQFVGLGRVFTCPSGVLNVHAWSGGALTLELQTPLEPRVFFFSAGVVQDGRRLLCAVDVQGKATWFDYGPA